VQEVKRGASASGRSNAGESEDDLPVRNTLVLWYADAPPHHPAVISHTNDERETKAFPEGSTDWLKLSFLASKLNMTIFSFIAASMDTPSSAFYVLLSQITGGLCITSQIQRGSGSDISRLTLDVVLQWMGQDTDIDARLESTNVKFSVFPDSPKTIYPPPTNETTSSLGFLPPPLKIANGTPLRSITTSRLHGFSIPTGPLAYNLSQRFKDPSQSTYREQVYTALHSIIDTNVHALTYNPIFGQLWRTVCSQHPPPQEQSVLLNAFSRKVGDVKDAEKKKALQEWLEESYDATEQIEDMISQERGRWGRCTSI
jgi:hypothetical protein